MWGVISFLAAVVLFSLLRFRTNAPMPSGTSTVVAILSAIVVVVVVMSIFALRLFPTHDTRALEDG
jgi:hypothetical protein